MTREYPAKKEKKQEEKKKSIHGRIERATFNFKIPGETLVAIHNALAFTHAHKEQYQEEINLCEHCMDAMLAMRRQIAHMLEYSGAYSDVNNRMVN